MEEALFKFQVFRLTVYLQLTPCSISCHTLLTRSVPHFFLIVAKWIYQIVQSHTGLTHPYNFSTFGHYDAQSWAPDCPNVKRVKTDELDQYGTAEHFISVTV